jgi:diguanylate cyclase (GGDEF)-like protein
MNLSTRSLLLVFLLPGVVVLLGAWAMRSAFEAQERADAAALQTTAVIGDVHQLVKLAVDAETGVRGYVLTEDVRFLEPYDAALRHFDVAADALELRLVDHPGQLARLARFRVAFQHWREVAEERQLRPIRDGLGAGPARDYVRSGAGKEIFDGLRAIAAELIAEQRVALAARSQDVQRAKRRTNLGAFGVGVGILVATALAVLMVARFVRETRRLASVAGAIAAGDLHARTHASGTSELAQLGATLDLLAHHLDERTTEATLLEQLRAGLYACRDRDEAARVLKRIASRVFPTGAGALYLINPSREQVERDACWRGDPTERFALDDCWALRRGQPYLHDAGSTTLACAHLPEDAPGSLCLPLAAASETLGILYLELPAGTRLSDPLPRRAALIAETIALSLANLRLRESLRNQAIRDALTGLYNRRYMEETLARELARAARTRSSVSVVIFDVDHFKKYNDQFGHSGGDAVLRELGALAASTFRASDVVCRFGGEEFVAILPDSPLTGAYKRAESLRADARRLSVRHNGETLGSISISAGVSVFPEDGATPEALLAAADEALYRSKREGRDRVTAAGAPGAASDA